MQALPAGLKRLAAPARRSGRTANPPAPAAPAPELTADQSAVLAAINLHAGFSAHLLHGVTGSGKTEVYLRLIERTLATGRQVLLLVPEINLTTQLEGRVRGGFPESVVVSLHSELAEAARERNWPAAFSGEASIVLGTRLSTLRASTVFTYILACAVLFESAEAALNALAGPLAPKGNGRTRKRVDIDPDVLMSEYVHQGGNYAKVGKRLGKTTASVAYRLTSMGLPNMIETECKSTQKALSAYLDEGCNLQQSAERGGVSQSE